MNAPVSIKTFSSRDEAIIAQGLLNDNGIPSMLKMDDVGGLYAALALSSGVELLVEETDAEKASELLEEAPRDSARTPAEA